MKIFRKIKNIILIEDDLLPENNECKFFFIEEIKPLANGKIRFVVNNIKIDNLDN